MFDKCLSGRLNRRNLLAAAAMTALAGCAVVPKAPAPAPAPTPAPTQSTLPTDTERHRIALLVPVSGTNAGVGQSIAPVVTPSGRSQAISGGRPESPGLRQ